MKRGKDTSTTRKGPGVHRAIFTGGNRLQEGGNDNYLETFKVLGREYSIEDFKAPGEHFFDGRDSSGKPRKRFALWAGGCGIGLDSETLVQARQRLHTYIKMEASLKRSKLEAELRAINNALITLGSNEFNLAQFKVKK